MECCLHWLSHCLISDTFCCIKFDYNDSLFMKIVFFLNDKIYNSIEFIVSKLLFQLGIQLSWKVFLNFLLGCFLDSTAHDSCSSSCFSVNDNSSIDDSVLLRSGNHIQSRVFHLNHCQTIQRFNASKIANVKSGFIFGLIQKEKWAKIEIEILHTWSGSKWPPASLHPLPKPPSWWTWIPCKPSVKP